MSCAGPLLLIIRNILCTLVLFVAYTSFVDSCLRWHARKVLGGGYKHKPGLQSGPGLLLVSGLGFVLGQVEGYIAIPNSHPYVSKQFMALFHTNHCSAFLSTGV